MTCFEKININRIDGIGVNKLGVYNLRQAGEIL